MTGRSLPANVHPRPSDALDEVVLLDDAGAPVGRADRLRVHSTDTPLHLAFSTYIFNARDEVLLTRRALGKKTWPGVWTNSCCGHPRPGEAIEDAVRRRVREELGLHVGPLFPLVPDFRYRATDASGVVENEVCPVFGAFLTEQDPAPDAGEVSEWAWVPWAQLVAAIEATPLVYSPWAALQVPRIGTSVPSVRGDRFAGHDATAAVDAVDRLLSAELAALGGEWQERLGDLRLDVLPDDLPRWLADVLVGRGKRLRVTMSYWGFVAAGGRHDTGPFDDLIRIAAALETLHLFALVHDDVMDGSASRRGRPAAHVQAERWHRAAGGLGDSGVFGRNLAILLGDLAHALADRLVAPLPGRLREAWYAMVMELIAGQRADLTGAAAGRTDPVHADRVGQLKSGRYSVVRPLELGALAAGADLRDLTWLTTCGEHIGRAFALRDDYLGVWGDPERTGKPAGDDLLAAKGTVLLDLARHRVTGSAREVLDRIGTPGFGPEEVAVLTDAMREAGVDTEVERLIAESVDAALACLARQSLAVDCRAGLAAATRAAAWRES